jgi:hypothetical protein
MMECTGKYYGQHFGGEGVGLKEECIRRLTEYINITSRIAGRNILGVRNSQYFKSVYYIISLWQILWITCVLICRVSLTSSYWTFLSCINPL